MRLRTTLTAITLLFAQSTYALDIKEINFQPQAAAYHFASQASSSYLTLDGATAKTEEKKFDSKLPRYLRTSEDKDWDYLLGQTATIFGLSVATVGLMTLLPESITKWDDEDRDITRLGSKWWDNVSSGPTWDEDEHYLNYIMHPYFGGVYYTAARHAGFNEFESFIYSFVMSSFFWEYGVEAFAEVPSIQDIIVTPLFGALVGELMYKKEQDIIARGEVLGSETLADISIFLLNPVGKIHYWLTDWWGLESNLTFTQNPWFDNKDAQKFAYDAGANSQGEFFGLQFTVKF